MKNPILGDAFDPKADFVIHDGKRPHWSQAGVIVFITARLHDSIPTEVLSRWDREKQDWIERHGGQGYWADALTKLPESLQAEFRQHFSRCRDDLLDDCLGQCVLQDPANAAIVADSLLHFDGDRYRMGDFVIMPNHFHLLAAFPDEASMQAQCDSWLHFTATQINRRTGSKGKLWQQEPFDHLIRTSEQYDYLRDYIANNPKKARLPEGEFLYRRFPHTR